MLLSGFLDPSANQNGPAMSLDAFETGVGTVVVGINLEEEKAGIVETFSLDQNYPNPFNPETTIEFHVPAGYHGNVKIKIYNMLGQQVKTIVNKKLPPGTHQFIWDGRNDHGVKVASGVYFLG